MNPIRFLLAALVVSCLLVSCLLVSCAPTTKRLTETVTGASSLMYRTSGWEVIRLVAQQAPQLQPTDAHSFYATDLMTDTMIRLVATPVKGSAIFTSASAYEAKPITLTITVTDKDDYTVVTLDGAPARSDDVNTAKKRIIQQLDAAFRRHTP